LKNCTPLRGDGRQRPGKKQALKHTASIGSRRLLTTLLPPRCKYLHRDELARQRTLHFRRQTITAGLPRPPSTREPVGVRVFADTQTDMLPGIPESAICVQNFDDSLNSAIHTTYRISLRSSSLREPRYPLLRVVFGYRVEPTLSR
jgi:hypothetical protein